MQNNVVKLIFSILIFLALCLVMLLRNDSKVFSLKTLLRDYDSNNHDYGLILDIPKINLRKSLAPKNSSNNHLDKNIQILNESDMPDKEGGLLILAAHSGNNYNAYFKDIHKLQDKDKIYIYYKKVKYTYEVYRIYDIEKTGKTEIITDKNKTIITLITCIPNTNRQLVIMGNLINEEKL